MIIFSVTYSSRGPDYMTTKEQRAGYLEEIGVGAQAEILSNGHLRTVNFALTWCDEDEASDVY